MVANVDADVYVKLNYGLKKVSNVTVNLINLKTSKIFSNKTNDNGECVIKVSANLLDDLYGEYKVELNCDDYGADAGFVLVTRGYNELFTYLVKLDDCKNKILTKKDCKYFYNEPYFTPNNYDLYFDHSKIPTNVIKESPPSLLKRLQKTMPLTDILHLNLQTDYDDYVEVNSIYSGAKLRYSTKDLSMGDVNLRIVCEWLPYVESDVKLDRLYNISFNNGDVGDGVVVKLVNKEYPLVEYEQVADNSGVCEFSDLPMGVYYQQFSKDDRIYDCSIVEIENDEELNIVLDETANLAPYDFLSFTVRVINMNSGSEENNYVNGELLLEDAEHISGVLNYGEDIVYENGKLIVYTGVVVDEVVLNSLNGFMVDSMPLPVFDSVTGEKIYYSLSWDMSYCSVRIENIEEIGIVKNEVVLF